MARPKKRSKHDFTAKVIELNGMAVLVATNSMGAEQRRETRIPYEGTERETKVLADAFAEELNRKYCLPPGMILRGSTYYAKFNHGGRTYRESLSKDYSVAKSMLEDLRQRAERGEIGKLDNDVAWDDVKADFLKLAKQTMRTHKTAEADLVMFEKFRKVRSIREITPSYIYDFRDWRLSGGGCGKNRSTVTPRTANRQVATLQSMLNKAVEDGTIGSNPIASVKPLRHDSPAKQRRSLTADEVTNLLAVMPENLRPMFLVYLTTGMRRDEVVTLKFSDIDYRRRVAVIKASNSKTGKQREVFLDDAALAAIERLHVEAKNRKPTPMTPEGKFSRDHVFVTKLGTPRTNNLLRQFYTFAQRAGIKDAHPGGAVDIHALRGSFISLAIEGGADPKAIQEIVGHANLEMTMNVYAKATEKGKRNAVNALPFANASTPDVIRFDQAQRQSDCPKNVPHIIDSPQIKQA